MVGNQWKNWLLARLTTDEGLHEIGEGTLNGFAGTVEAAATTSSVATPHVYDEAFVAVVDLLRHGAVRAEPLVSARIPLRRALDDGLLALKLEPAVYLKIVIQPSGVGA